MDDKFKEHIESYISSFVPKNKRDRWKYTITKDHGTWGKLSSHDCTEPELSDWNTSPSQNIQKAGIEKHLNSDVYVFPIGHGAIGDGPYKSTLKDVLLGDDWPSECIISIIPGKLAISYGHSNEFRFCSKVAPNK